MKVKKIILHITATKPDATVEEITKMHIARGFSTIGYHFLVDQSGNIIKGRDETIPGAHCFGHNSDSIGISYISRGSDTDSKSPFGKYMTEPQKTSYLILIAELINKYHLTVTDVYGHNFFNKGKACPCFQVDTELKKTIQSLLDTLQKSSQNPPELAEAVNGEDFDDDYIPNKAIPIS
ncbi:MAG: N-acetylmuramoyl-L-alanine amidase [Ignavibacteria bacterium]|nr:N-acetylmuramoyl-L-alanine amidase [Ignavibacteria bacterium]